MVEYTFNESYSSIYELNSIPRIAYIQKISSYSEYLNTLHTHQNLVEVFFIEDGFNSCSINNHHYKIKKGDIILINSDILHNTLSNNQNLTGIILGIKNLHFKGLSKNQLIENKLKPIISVKNCCIELQSLFSLLVNLIKIDSSRTIDKSALANCTLQIILMAIYDSIKNNQSSIESQNYNLGLKIKLYIDEHFTENITLTEIAQALHINSYYLSHTCKKYLGYSPIQYITNQRIKEAQKLLLNTDLTVTEIAFRCGYNNSNYFQTVFNNIVGMPPGKYRKAWQ